MKANLYDFLCVSSFCCVFLFSFFSRQNCEMLTEFSCFSFYLCGVWSEKWRTKKVPKLPNKCFIIKIMMPWFYCIQKRKQKIAFPQVLKEFHFIWILFTVRTYKYAINHFALSPSGFWIHFHAWVKNISRMTISHLKWHEQYCVWLKHFSWG